MSLDSVLAHSERSCARLVFSLGRSSWILFLLLVALFLFFIRAIPSDSLVCHVGFFVNHILLQPSEEVAQVAGFVNTDLYFKQAPAPESIGEEL